MLRLRAVAFVPCEEYIKDKILAHVLAFLSSYSFLFCFLSQRCDLPFENFILYLHFGVDIRIVLRTLPNIYDRVFAQIFKGLMPLTHSVHPTPPPPLILSAGGGEEVNLQPNFQKRGWGGGGGLDRTSTFRVGCWERVGWLFSGRVGGCNFHIKSKLKSEIFNDNKSL